ncbi:MAG: type I DNA topoisomerase [Candidatus Campbellbacteria bacterium]|nr:type I DNA topoisomerase [Candidatus Campbellbacteria bacterium]
MKLVIVESPAKAKTIQKYLGDPYQVEASVGHIRDLPKSEKGAIDIDAGYVPHYTIPEEKKEVIERLSKLNKKATEVFFATDPDREGEAIAWHIKEVIKPKKSKRIVFHEITKEAIDDAIQNPRDIDINLRKAQEARRVLDRLFGYGLSKLVWKKVRYGLSAGRVQSPALRIIMEKEKEIRAFKPVEYWTIEADLKTKKGKKFKTVCKKEPKEKKEMEKILEMAKTGSWSVRDVEMKEAKRNPRPPFMTSTLQQAANTRLSFSSAKTMRAAQKLYEGGHITYMRTDSINLSKLAHEQIKKAITKQFGADKYSQTVYKTKSKVAQEAHEAIRPTNPSKISVGKTEDEKLLYKLILARTLASQMIPFTVMRTRVMCGTEDKAMPHFVINGSKTIEDGWTLADKEGRGDDVEIVGFEKGQDLIFDSIKSERKETSPPPRYSEAGLVKELNARDIGRPSTYVAIIRTLLQRGYVEKENKALVPTVTGELVNDFVNSHFGEYTSDSFTAHMEDALDKIALGRQEYIKLLNEFYKPFMKSLENKENIDKVTVLGDAPDEFKCPECGENMVKRLGRNGVFLSCSRFPDCKGLLSEDGKAPKKPEPTGEECPKCKKGGLIKREGRYGEFIGCENYPKCKFIKPDEDALEKAKTGVACVECGDGDIIERKGRFGPFFGCSNYPDCSFTMRAKPTGKKCKLCKKLMMEGTKTIPERCSDKQCENHNPHKIK